MIRPVCLLFTALLLLASCAGNTTLPSLAPAPEKHARCTSFFPQGNFQFVHRIDFTMPGSQSGSAIGVTVLHGTTLESALMTVEGFVLFAATLTDRLTVTRAVPPFDKPGFARGMMQDIQAIFLIPQGTATAGALPDGTAVCRITKTSGGFTDILARSDQCLQLNLYSAEQQLLSRISGSNCSTKLANTFIPANLELNSQQMGGYSLHMTLISAEPISPAP